MDFLRLPCILSCSSVPGAEGQRPPPRRDEDRPHECAGEGPCPGFPSQPHRPQASSSWRREADTASSAGAHQRDRCQAPCGALRATDEGCRPLLSLTACSWVVLLQQCWRRDAASQAVGYTRWWCRQRRAAHALERPPGGSSRIGIAQWLEGSPSTGACVIGHPRPRLLWLTRSQAMALRGTPSAKP